MSRGRHPHSPTDDPVWAAFCAGVEPLNARGTPAGKNADAPAHASIAAPIYYASTEAEDFAQLMQEWEAGQGSFQATTPAAVPASPAPAVVSPRPTPQPTPPPRLNQWHGIDAATARKLARGQIAIDAVLDLHGLNLEQGFSSICGMVQLGRMRGWRLLLVITGKGRSRHEPGLVEGDGKLRRALPRWLADAQLAPHVIAAGTAHVRHGGHGAYYLLLRRAARGLASDIWESRA